MAGFTGIWPAALGHIADLDTTAFRVYIISGAELRFRQWTGSQLHQSASAAGISATALDCRGFSQGTLFYQGSGESAILRMLVSPNNADWWPLSSIVVTAGMTGSARFTGTNPYMRSDVTAVWSGANLTGTVNAWLFVSP